MLKRSETSPGNTDENAQMSNGYSEHDFEEINPDPEGIFLLTRFKQFS